MSIQIRTPNITAQTDQERLRQIQSYLYQMAGQLQWAFDNIGTAGGSGNGSNYPQSTAAAPSGNTGSASAMETFSQLKNLIIKSADIVEAFYDAIKIKLEGLYVAQSDFGDYVEQTQLLLDANSKSITQNYTNIQSVQTNLSGLSGQVGSVQNSVGVLFDNVDGVQNTVGTLSGQVGSVQNSVGVLFDNVGSVQNTVGNLSGTMGELQEELDTVTAFIVETNAYIKSGLLGEKTDGTSIYGLEIGQSNTVNGQAVFDKFARFTADRLSFYDSNDVEVAYISDYKLYITNAEITGSLWLSGRFKIYYKGGLAFQWIGGEQ